MTLRMVGSSLCLAGALLLWAPSRAQDSATSSTVPITTTVTILGRNHAPAPEVPQEDVIVHSGKNVLKVIGWQRAQSTEPGSLELAFLIDEDARASLLGRQLGDMANFIQAQPPSTAVGVFYAQNGSAVAASRFTTDHAEAAKSLRLTLGRGGASASIYLSLGDLATHWPSSHAVRREVLMMSSGKDNLDPGVQDPYFDSAIHAVQKAGINVHTIYVGSTRYGLTVRGDISQGKLAQTTDDTGGQSFIEGVSSPISFAPYLDELNQALNSQYLLTFTMERSRKKSGELREIQVRTEERTVKVSAPREVFVPGP
jgi:hypothetical protein